MRAAGSFDDLQPVELPDRSPRFSICPVLGAAAGVLALALLGYYATAGLPFDFGRAKPSQTAQAPAVEPDRTGAIAPANLAALEATGPLRGVPDVLDTATLWVEGKIVHLYGVEWVRGAGNPDEFTRYLRGRVVVCTPVASANAHRCIARWEGSFAGGACQRRRPNNRGRANPVSCRRGTGQVGKAWRLEQIANDYSTPAQARCWPLRFERSPLSFS